MRHQCELVLKGHVTLFKVQKLLVFISNRYLTLMNYLLLLMHCCFHLMNYPLLLTNCRLPPLDLYSHFMYDPFLLTNRHFLLMDYILSLLHHHLHLVNHSLFLIQFSALLIDLRVQLSEIGQQVFLLIRRRVVNEVDLVLELVQNEVLILELFPLQFELSL